APGVVWSGSVGGSNLEVVHARALDAQGAVTVAGMTRSADFPTTPGSFHTTFRGHDAFVTKLSPTGSSLVYSTFLGGGYDEAMGLALDAQGGAIVAGWTGSSIFPTTPGAFDTTPARSGITSAFVTSLSPTGTSLASSTFPS